MDLSESFDTVRGFRQSDPLLCDLFKFVMGSVMRKAGVDRNGTIFQKSVVSEILLLSTSRDVRRIASHFMEDNYSFDIVKEFINLGSAHKLT